MTVAEILKAEPQSANVFQKFGLDISKCGQSSFEAICKTNSIDTNAVKHELLNLRHSLIQAHTSFGHLLGAVLSQHEKIKKAIPAIHKALFLKYEHRHLRNFEKVKKKFEMLMNGLEVHLYKEEMILFPEFINLWNKKLYQTEYRPPFRMMHPLEGVETEHKWATTILQEIRELTLTRSQPGCTHKNELKIFEELESFRKNMEELIDLESRLLFPEALGLEKNIIND